MPYSVGIAIIVGFTYSGAFMLNKLNNPADYVIAGMIAVTGVGMAFACNGIDWFKRGVKQG